MHNELIQKIKFIEDEVLALKQAHDYGLGRVDLSTKEIKTTLSGTSYSKMYVTITFYNSAIQPIVQYWNVETLTNWETDFVIDSFSGNTMVLVGDIYTGADEMNYDIIFSATAPITSISWSVE